MKQKKLAMVLGIRPDVIRCSILIKLLKRELGENFVFIWSGQHYSDNMKDIFFRELSVPLPDITFNLDTTTDVTTISSLSMCLDRYLKSNDVAAVIYLGDTNTVASSIACASNNIPIIHIEGCMRSYDWRMPEEKYRTQIDHLSDYIYAYLEEYKAQGVAEGIDPKRIIVTGNPIVDVLNEYFLSGKIRLSAQEKSELLGKFNLVEDKYSLMTCHRRENIDDARNLQEILNLVEAINHPIIFAAGYRTQQKIKEFNLKLPKNITMVDPIGYRELLELMFSSNSTLTDSGTIVEEASVLGIPTIQMRTSTERPQVYDVEGSIKFDPSISHSQADILTTIERLERIIDTKWKHILGDGLASKRIADDLIQKFRNETFNGHNPDFEIYQVRRNFGEGIKSQASF